MSETNTLTLQELQKCPWQDVIVDSTEKTCYAFSKLFLAKSRESLAENNLLYHQIYSLLGFITSLRLNTDAPNHPFKDQIGWTSGGNGIEAISDHNLSLLRDIVEDIVDPEMRARVQDVLWIKNRDHQMAKEAVMSYLESFKQLENPVNWVDCFVRIERAAQLARFFGKDKAFLDQTVELIEVTLEKYKGEDPSFLSAKLMELLLHHRYGGDPVKYAELALICAVQAEKDSNWEKARVCWGIASQWNKVSKDLQKRIESDIAYAESYVKQADEAVAQPNSFMTAATFIQRAIEAYRRVSGQNTRIEELHRILLEYQQKSIDELRPLAIEEPDFSIHHQRAIQSVTGKGLVDALMVLASIWKSASKSSLRSRVERNSSQFVARFLLSSILVNEKGRNIAREPSMLSDDPDEKEKAIRFEMYKEAKLNQRVGVVGYIDPARTQILQEHYVREQDLLPLVVDNPFVPQGREMSYYRGLHAGLHGDFMVSTHLLVPQVENSIRHILYESGKIVSGLDADGIQDEKNLNSLLFLPELTELLGDDLAFDLQGLLVERAGSNLRNNTAHGLMDDYGYFSVEAEYLWWIVLRICFLYRQLNPQKAQ